MIKHQGFTNIGKQISNIIKPIVKKKGAGFIIVNNLQQNWSTIIGDKYYQFSSPYKIVFPPKQKIYGTLYVEAYNPAIAFFIEANVNQIIEKIACYYGYKIINKIIIKQQVKNIKLPDEDKSEAKISKEQHDFIKNSLLEIKDADLQSSLYKLGKAIFSENSE